jgi:hypothetical protein
MPAPRPKVAETRLDAVVSATDRTLVSLERSKVVASTDSETGWDLAFEGLGVFTNSGPSGPGAGSAYGPLDVATFQSAPAPAVSFLVPDTVGGAFAEWYVYDRHVFRSRYHVLLVRDASRIWKVQVLDYYADDLNRLGGLYQIRYAELAEPPLESTTVELTDVDGTGGAGDDPDGLPSECVDLGTGARTFLTVEAARAATDWHLCFRHQSILVNGGLSGSRGVQAVDLDGASTASEIANDVQGKSAESELPHFDSIDRAAGDDPSLRWMDDGVVSAFSDRWITPGSDPPVPLDAAWLVTSADGVHSYLVAFESFENVASDAAGTVRMRIKRVE